MTRRNGLKLSAVAVASALLVGCGKTGDPREKRRAHSLAMFLLVLQPNYLQEVLGPKDQIARGSLLLKVMPSVFDSMRAYYLSKASNSNDAAILVQKYRDIHTELFNATSTASLAPNAQSNAQPADQPPYSTPDECPCLIDNSCPPVEALLGF